MENDRQEYDVIIVGGGFAGITAARELHLLGYDVLLLEGRDRLGGRTWTDHRLGSDLEIGGTYVHWFQPHVWTEISRYGLELSTAPTPRKAYWITGGKLYEGTPSELNSKVKDSFEKLLAEAQRHLPLPFQPLKTDSLREMDGVTATEFINHFNFRQEEEDFINSLFCIDFNGSPEEGGISQMFRWWAFSNGDRNVFADTVSRYKIKTGTGSLIQKMADDTNADILLSTAVQKVVRNGEEVRIHTADGKQFRAKAAIVTVPLSALDEIEFRPALSEQKQAFIREKQVSKGVKIWVRAKGALEPFVSYAPEGYPLNSAHLDKYIDGDSLIVAFGSDESCLDPNDAAAVEAALKQWIPDLQVIESTGHKWIEDSFSKETWPMLKPGQLTNYIEEMRRPEQGVFLAGTAYANGWAGFIDGAIENAVWTSRNVHRYLAGL